MRFILEDSEIKNILEMHSNMKKKVIKEQSNYNSPVAQQLQGFLDNKCVPSGKVRKMTSTNPQMEYAIEQESSQTRGKFRYLFLDRRVFTVENGKFVQVPGKWVCDQPAPPAPPTPPSTPTTLNDNHKAILKDLERQGWTTEKISDYEIDNGQGKKMDLTEVPTDPTVKNYSTFFTKKDFPQGFWVYRKTINAPSETTATAASEVNISGQNCKTAIDSLYRHMMSPSSVPLTNAQIDSYKSIAQKCAEPANRKMFRFGMNNELKKIANYYGIEIRR